MIHSQFHIMMRPTTLTFLAMLSFGAMAGAAPIPGLFNTGVDDDGNLLAGSGAVDPHYTITESADEDFTGPDAVTLNPGFPVGPWLGEGPDSRWIAPNPVSGDGAEGNYTYKTTFDLTGFDPGKAVINGLWGVDNGGVDIILNGDSLGIVNNGGFVAMTEFVIDFGFVEGENTLEFIVSNAPATRNPTGLRVEMRGTVEVVGEAPSILKQPESKNIFLGETAAFTVDADGSPPLSYQWLKDDGPLEGATGSEYVIDAVSLEDAGMFKAVVTNADGSKTSDPARLAVVQPLTGLFNTGVGEDGELLEDFEVDPHYILVVNPDAESPDALVQDSNIWPIVAGPWLPNTAMSKWIGAREDTNGTFGIYHYRFTFEITGFDPETIFVSGNWATDNGGNDILVNGKSSGRTGGAFTEYTPFTVDGGFVAGSNTLEFIVSNAGDADNPTGLRIEGIRGGGVALDVPTQLVTQPQDATAFEEDSVVLESVGTGVPPISYQWRFNGDPIDGATEQNLTLPGVGFHSEGEYDVVVTAGQGSVTSESATVTVLSSIPGLFNTGVGDDGAPLEDLEIDPHYQLVVNPDSESVDAIVGDTQIWPIVAGPWVATSDTSKWIGAREDTNGMPGEYTYRTTFDLTGFDLSTVFISAQWAVDDSGPDIVLNEEFLGLTNSTGFGGLAEFEILEGFKDGINTLEFLVNNGGDADNPTGLRIENLVAGGRQIGGGPASFMITSIARTTEQVSFEWNSRTGETYTIEYSETLGSWIEIDDSVDASGASTPYADASPERAGKPDGYYRVRRN
jgi:hypothetical protein